MLLAPSVLNPGLTYLCLAGMLGRMRTTVRLKDDLLKQAKRRAAKTHRSFTAFLEDAIRASLAPRASEKSSRKKVILPVSGKGGTLPGIQMDDSASLHDVMDGLR